MKTVRIILIVLNISLPFGLQQALAQNDDGSAPKSKYNVHREYDDNGNLIEYDSTSITTWNSNSSKIKPDSVQDFWSYTPSFDDTTKTIENRSKNYGFRFPGDVMDEWPQFDFGLEFNNIDSVWNGFNYYFSLTPGDTAKHFQDPYFDLYGQFPPVHPDIESYMQDMQHIIHDMIDRNEDMFREFHEKDRSSMPSNKSDADSISEPTTPKPLPQNNSGPVFNI
jgi:hypothetical protein